MGRRLQPDATDSTETSDPPGAGAAKRLMNTKVRFPRFRNRDEIDFKQDLFEPLARDHSPSPVPTAGVSSGTAFFWVAA